MFYKKITNSINYAHESWRESIYYGLSEMEKYFPGYLEEISNSYFLPTNDRIFATFSQPIDAVRYVLVGEGPYPREESATGFCFMDGAVDNLWSEKGLSKQVNRATSLRNFMKMLLVAEGALNANQTKGQALVEIGQKNFSNCKYIQTIAELKDNLLAEGFLLLNATLVFRPEVAPSKEARPWSMFFQSIIRALEKYSQEKSLEKPTLILWGKIAEQMGKIQNLEAFPKIISEHPYNISFISNNLMQSLFKPMNLLRRR